MTHLAGASAWQALRAPFRQGKLVDMRCKPYPVAACVTHSSSNAKATGSAAEVHQPLAISPGTPAHLILHPPLAHAMQACKLDPRTLTDAVYAVAQHLHQRARANLPSPPTAVTHALLSALQRGSEECLPQLPGKELGLLISSLALMKAGSPSLAAKAAECAMALPPTQPQPLYLLKLVKGLLGMGHAFQRPLLRVLVGRAAANMAAANPALMAQLVQVLETAGRGQELPELAALKSAVGKLGMLAQPGHIMGDSAGQAAGSASAGL